MKSYLCLYPTGIETQVIKQQKKKTCVHHFFVEVDFLPNNVRAFLNGQLTYLEICTHYCNLGTYFLYRLNMKLTCFLELVKYDENCLAAVV